MSVYYDERGSMITDLGGGVTRITPSTHRNYVPPTDSSPTVTTHTTDTAPAGSGQVGLPNLGSVTYPTPTQEEKKVSTNVNVTPTNVSSSSGQYDDQIQSLISQLTGAINNMPTVESIMSSPAMQQMQAAIQGQMDQAMQGARADLAARGVFGKGSTPAADRLGQVAGFYGQQLGSLVPNMMSADTSMRQAQNSALQNLVSLLSGLDQQNWQRGITEFQTYTPYYAMTAGERANMAQWIVNTFPQLGLTPQEVEEWLSEGGI